MISKLHNYYFLSFNSLPLMISIGCINLMMSFLIFFKGWSMLNFFLGLMILICFSFIWWVLYILEFSLEGKDSYALEKGIKVSMILFIFSEIFFFFSFFWSYFHFFLVPTLEVGFSWPPSFILMFDYSNVPMVNTLILLSSGVSITVSHYYFNISLKFNGNIFLLVTIILGSFFTFLQLEEYLCSFFSLTDANFGSSFFMLTGFHGLHVIIGSTFLIFCLMRSLGLSFTSKSTLSFELASWYWHFVDVVWIYLYFSLYYLSNF